MRYWFDTEFMEDGYTIELLSIGMVAEDGREFYAESAEADFDHANEWVRDNVLPHLGELVTPQPRREIASDLLAFVGRGEGTPEFWAYYGDYDWVVLCQLYGRMIDLPSGWPMYAKDVKQRCDDLGNPRLPQQESTEHHALADARWTKQAWHFLESLRVAETRRNDSEPAGCPTCGRSLRELSGADAGFIKTFGRCWACHEFQMAEAVHAATDGSRE